jgi:hypothetical protein
VRRGLLGDDKYIDFLRTAKQKDLTDPNKMESLAEFEQKLMNGPLNLDNFADHIRDIFAGSLMFSTIDDRDADIVDPIEEMIKQSSAEQYRQAREFFRFMTSVFGVQILSDLEIGRDAEARQDTFKALRDSARGDPRWAASLLVAGLALVRMFGKGFNADEMWSVVSYFKENNMKFHDLICATQSHENKET